MARVESVFHVEKDLPEFLSSVLDRTEEYIRSNETNIKQFVILDRTVSLLNSVAFEIEQDRIEWESLATAFSEVLRAIENHIKTLAVDRHQFHDVNADPPNGNSWETSVLRTCRNVRRSSWTWIYNGKTF